MVGNHRAFTLVELLVVIGLIAILIALGSAGTGKLIQQSKTTKALSNLRQIGVAAQLFAADNQGLLPQSSHQGPAKAWTRTLASYLPAGIFVSPFDTETRTLSYAINDFNTANPFGAEDLDFSRLQSQPTPTRTLFMGVLNRNQRNADHFHFAEDGYTPAQFPGEVWAELVNHASHYLFVDGHVECLRWSDVQILLITPGSTFIRPDGNH